MSFLGFGKSKKNQSSALPAATRDIASSHGPDTRVPTANGIASPANPNGMERRGTIQNHSQPQSQQPSVNTSLESMRGMATPLAEPGKAMRERAESDLSVRAEVLGEMLTDETGQCLTKANDSQGSRSNSVRANGAPPADSPYPWSQRRLNFTSNISPFPRYGSAVNSTASKEGWIYMMGGLVNSQMVKGDLWMVEVGNGSMNCFPVNTTSEGPGPRVGHASLLVGNAFIVFGGDTKLEDGDLLDDTLYLLNTGMCCASKFFLSQDCTNIMQPQSNGQELLQPDHDPLAAMGIRSTYSAQKYTFLAVKLRVISSMTSLRSTLIHCRLQATDGKL
jgi:hypothetical protein